jgi:1,4-dihydroxy-2-naphthoyl-CoA hydrolase
MFTYATRIFLHHTDAAGRLFYANQFFLMHEAKELFLEKIGLSIKELLDHPETSFPLVHAEADFKSILIAGEGIRITVEVEKVGETSITVLFVIYKADGTLAGTGKTVNVAVSKKTGKKMPIPPNWRAAYEKQLKK